MSTKGKAPKGDRQVDRVFEPGVGQAQAQENFAMWSKALARAKDWVK